MRKTCLSLSLFLSLRLLAAVRPQIVSAPEITLIGTFPGSGVTTISPGDWLSVVGSSFCGAPDCGAITFEVGHEVLPARIKVAEDGSFVALVSVATLVPSRSPYTLSVTQHGQGQMLLRASRQFVLTPDAR
jgi:hypothetical protein